MELLNDEHDRTEFMSGSAALDRYFQTQASQDTRPDRYLFCRCQLRFGTNRRILHFERNQRRLGYSFAAALLGRLAVARTQQGLDLGGVLLADALKRSARARWGCSQWL
jgi:hypothetical protein